MQYPQYKQNDKHIRPMQQICSSLTKNTNMLVFHMKYPLVLALIIW